MKLGKYIILVAALGLSGSVLAQSSTSGMSNNAGATGVNETNAKSATVPGVKPEGSGSADQNSMNRSGTSKRSAARDHTQSKNTGATSSAASGTAGTNP